MTTQPQDPKTRSVELLEEILDATATSSALLSDLSNEIRQVLAVIQAMATAAASQPVQAAPAVQLAGQAYQDFTAAAIIMTYNDKGEPAYKIMGYPFNTYGVRVWPETLPALGIDPDQLKPGPNPYTAQVRALMVESSTKPGTMTPRKIIGMAP